MVEKLQGYHRSFSYCSYFVCVKMNKKKITHCLNISQIQSEHRRKRHDACKTVTELWVQASPLHASVFLMCVSFQPPYITGLTALPDITGLTALL